MAVLFVLKDVHLGCMVDNVTWAVCHLEKHARSVRHTVTTDFVNLMIDVCLAVRTLTMEQAVLLVDPDVGSVTM